MDYSKRISNYTDIINKKLSFYLSNKKPEHIFEVMSYSIFSGGKRIRPLLMLACIELLNGDIEKNLPFACSLEMIHVYSLIHDDLPAMDDDDFRRGKPTSHKVFGEAMAILAGDGLLNLAFEVLADFCLENFELKNNFAQKIIVKSAGTNGMLGGQVVDILSENKKIDEETILYIHENKTSALFKASLSAGAACAGADLKTINFFEELGKKLGLAFQIKDDILDVTSTQDVLGKPVNSDEKNNKNTFVSIFGLSEAEKRFNDLSNDVLKSISSTYGKDNLLYFLSEFLVSRKN